MLEFVKASGSLKDMAKKMGVSYPTVRNYLDDLIEKLNNMEEKMKDSWKFISNPFYKVAIIRLPGGGYWA